ncbi:MAG: AMP-binding protein [Parahaliea sp.]
MANDDNGNPRDNTHYYHSYVGKNIPWLLGAQAETRPHAPFFYWEPFNGESEVWTYRHFHHETCRLAAGLQESGIQQGDYVLLHMHNCPQYLLTWHACAMLGAVVVTTNPRASAQEMAYFISHSTVRFAITQPAFLGLIKASGDNFHWIACTDTDGGEPAGAEVDCEFLLEDLFGIADRLEPADIGPLENLSVQYTSGTTSRPKGVVWTHANALWAGQVGAAHNTLTENDVGLVFTPLCHTNAMSWAHLPVLWSGSSFALQPRFSSSRFWAVATQHRCTWANVIPFAVQALASVEPPERHDFRHWVVGFANSGELEKRLNVPFVGAWGMTEIVTHATFTPLHLPTPEMSMGMPSTQYQLKVVDPLDNPTPVGEIGLLKVKGVPGISLFKEYLFNPEATTASFDEQGWFDTGDLVRVLESGHLRFSDRAKDMLKVGGENVAASEIEVVVARVNGVLEAAVVGKPDPLRSELPVVFVRAQNPCEDLTARILQRCRDELPDFKVPIEVHYLDDFPRSELNKIAKKELRAMVCSD